MQSSAYYTLCNYYTKYLPPKSAFSQWGGKGRESKSENFVFHPITSIAEPFSFYFSIFQFHIYLAGSWPKRKRRRVEKNKREEGEKEDNASRCGRIKHRHTVYGSLGEYSEKKSLVPSCVVHGSINDIFFESGFYRMPKTNYESAAASTVRPFVR